MPGAAMGKHRCAKDKFTYSKDVGAEVITDPAVYPLAEWAQNIDASEPTAEFWSHDTDLKEWDYISVHNYESCEGITSGHVYKLVGDDGVIVGDVVLTW